MKKQNEVHVSFHLDVELKTHTKKSENIPVESQENKKMNITFVIIAKVI